MHGSAHRFTSPLYTGLSPQQARTPPPIRSIKLAIGSPHVDAKHITMVTGPCQFTADLIRKLLARRHLAAAAAAVRYQLPSPGASQQDIH